MSQVLTVEDRMQSTILIVNKIKTLGRVTTESLAKRGYNNLKYTSTLEEAEHYIAGATEKVILILELTPSWNHHQEIEFLERVKMLGGTHLVMLLCTSEDMDSTLQFQFKNQGVDAFVFQRFDLDNYGMELQEAIEKNAPHLLGEN